jgi:UPF0148 protein
MNNDTLKKGADFLLKGGTLLSEPCQVCNGLLIKFKGDIMCLSCQKANQNTQGIEKTTVDISEEKKEEINLNNLEKDIINKNEPQEIKNCNDLLIQVEKTVIKRILENNKSINIENDIDKQKKNLKMLLLYLKIIEKLKRMKK